MTFDLVLLILYRLLALTVAVSMLWVLFRARDPGAQVFAVLVMIPFALRAAGIK